MSVTNTLLGTGLLPDSLIRAGIRRRLAATLDEHARSTPEEEHQAVLDHAAGLRNMPVAVNTDDANEQHYELPAEFFLRCLGPRLKYSSCYFRTGSESLREAEEMMLALTCERAELRDGQRILELGCGWGSLSLWMAEHYPNSAITVVSNSASQKKHIDAAARERGFTNLTVRTANMTDYAGEGAGHFDRVVSVEMFEHMKNYAILMQRIGSWLRPGGMLFVHIFTHKTAAYHYEAESDDDWMAKYFFTGGQMPSHDLLLHFQDDLKIKQHWQLPGTHYQLTSEHWLKKMDIHRVEILRIFGDTYGARQAKRWFHYWRIFYLSCAELWGYREGREWLVSHYLFEKPQPE